LLALGLEPIVCDVLEPDSLRTLPPTETVVYSVGFDRSAGQLMRDVYVKGLHNYCVLGPVPRRLLYISSTGVYGQSQGEEVDETSPAEPGDDTGMIVREAEICLHRHHPGAIVLRCAGIYGPGRLLRSENPLAGEPVRGDPDKWLNLIHVEDLAAAVLAAEARGQPGAVYNICDDRPVHRGEFYARLAELVGAPPPHFISPGPGDPLPRRMLANRRISNRRMHQELQVVLRYPSYAEGLPASL
jgi:nucleoside-diphosphate-sugar epimerase